MQKPRAKYDRSDIDKDTNGIAEAPCNVDENNLCHIIVWTDIEHIDHAVLIKGKIKNGCQQAAGKKNEQTTGKTFAGIVCFF